MAAHRRLLLGGVLQAQPDSGRRRRLSFLALSRSRRSGSPDSSRRKRGRTLAASALGADAVAGPRHARMQAGARLASPARSGKQPPCERTGTDAQVLAMMAVAERSGASCVRLSSTGERRAQLSRITTAHAEALAAGDVRRAARLGLRRDRVNVICEGQIGSGGGDEAAVRETAGQADPGGKSPGDQRAISR